MRAGARAAAALLLALGVAAAHAGPFERLLMPGPLSTPHAQVEGDCAQCHDRSGKTPEAERCLACHETVGADLAAKRGFHGRSPQVAAQACRQCHSEHRGRDADIVGLVPALFDHGHTDFPLEGQHRPLACDACHAAGKPHREAPSSCNDCHREDDVHRGAMGAACQDCHRPAAWKDTGFDHGKTGFPLRGGHAKVACASCHAAQKFKDTPTGCASCHRLQDRHGGLFGTSCGSCHRETGWAEARFDHAGKTGFSLLGRHAAAGCHACHTEASRQGELPTTCHGCHRASDVHQGRLGTQCGSCHQPDRWRAGHFDHARETGFALRGPHANVACEACHAEPARKDAPVRACIDCHRADDVHKGQLGDRCGSCHTGEQWPAGVRFEHDLTRFPLLGLHALAPCAECHRDHAFEDAPTGCHACHAARDVHQGGLGTDCARCHAPSGWNRWTFDHAHETGFALDDAHAGLACQACHRAPAGRGGPAPGRSCGACHADDDVHRGAFGADCGRCHTPTTFTDVQLRGRASPPRAPPEGR